VFDKLKKHHIGIVITSMKRKEMERQGISFHKDEVQGVHVAFVMDKALGMYKEYIVQEGRASKIKLGFYHICYSVENLSSLKEVEDFIRDKKLGFPITKLEKSGSLECGWVRFYYLKHHGVIELNLVNNLNV
jgi:hypothetical protein